MNLLAIDTSTHRAAIAVQTRDGATHVATPDPTQRHGRNLIPVLRDLLGAAGLAVADLDAVAVGLGPGSYTGLRIGLTAAKTLAYTTGCPLVGLDSLEVIAQNAPADEPRVSIIADAQRGDLYVADFVRSAPAALLVRVTPTRIAAAADWSSGLTEPTLVLGPGLERLASPLPQTARPAAAESSWPEGLGLLRLARASWLAGQRDDPMFLEPRYLRRSAAEEQWERTRPRT